VIWDLAKTVPVNGRWARTLGYLLDKTVNSRYEFNSLEVAKRWNVIDESEIEGKKKRFLNSFETIRCAIYKDIIRDLFSKDKSNQIHFDNEDLAYRACAYQKLNFITVENIKEAYLKDKLIAVEYLMKNTNIWKKEDLRKALHDICWDADDKFNNNLDCANDFNYKQEELTEKYPDWFAEKEEESFVDEDERVLTLGLAKSMLNEANYNQSVEILTEVLTTKHTVEENKTSIKWIFYLLIVLFVIEIYKH
jgi:hypothetical protein